MPATLPSRGRRDTRTDARSHEEDEGDDADQRRTKGGRSAEEEGDKEEEEGDEEEEEEDEEEEEEDTEQQDEDEDEDEDDEKGERRKREREREGGRGREGGRDTTACTHCAAILTCTSATPCADSHEHHTAFGGRAQGNLPGPWAPVRWPECPDAEMERHIAAGTWEIWSMGTLSGTVSGAVSGTVSGADPNLRMPNNMTRRAVSGKLGSV